jgi:hypothetical protein
MLRYYGKRWPIPLRLLPHMQVCFQSSRTLCTEELHSCIEANPSEHFVVDCAVAVTAPFGDRFRTICRYAMVATSASTTQLRIDYTMVYTKSMSGLARAMLEPAAESGLAKNFAQFIAALSSHVVLSDAVAPPLPSPPPEAIVPATLPGTGVAVLRLSPVQAILTAEGAQRRMKNVVQVFVDDHLLDLFLPAAEVLLMSAGVPCGAEASAGVRGTAALLSSAFVFLLLQLLLSCWHMVGGVCARWQTAPARLCTQVHEAIDLPRSVTGVIVAAVVILVVRSVLGGWAVQV